MSGVRRGLLVVLALAGWVAAVALSGWLVQLRYRGIDPAVVSAQSGMFAFGDLVAEVTLVAVLSIPGTWAFLRAVRDLAGFWRVVSWAGLVWAAGAPVALALRVLAALVPRVPGPVGPLRPELSIVFLDGSFGVLRLLASPASLPGLAVAWWACAHEPSRRRLGRAVGLELAGCLGGALWFVTALFRART